MENFNKSHGSIKNWAIDDRPREKMLAKGTEALSDSELLAIIINNGSKEKSAGTNGGSLDQQTWSPRSEKPTRFKRGLHSFCAS